MPLFKKEELEAYLQRQAAAPGDHQGDPVDPSAGIPTGTYEVIARVVDGWLLDATGHAAWPTWQDGVPPQLFAWALELGAIAHENPASAVSDTVDRQSAAWNENRRTTILARAAAWASDTPAAPLQPSPRGTFPPPPVPVRW